MNNNIDLTNVQKIDIIQNEIFGNLEIIKSSNKYYLIKKITNQLENLISKKKNIINNFSENEFPEMQRCYGKKILWSSDYLIFDYYDYTLETLQKNNIKNNCFLKENSILNLFYTLQICFSKLKKLNIIYPFLHKKCIFCSKEGKLKIANPLLFNEFFENRDLGENQKIQKLNFLMKNLGIILLENSSLVEISDESGFIDLDLIEKSFESVKSRYSFLILHILRLFNFGIKNDIRKKFYEDSSFFRINRFIDNEGFLNLEKKSVFRNNLEYDENKHFEDHSNSKNFEDDSNRKHTHKIFEYEKTNHWNKKKNNNDSFEQNFNHSYKQNFDKKNHNDSYKPNYHNTENYNDSYKPNYHNTENYNDSYKPNYNNTKNYDDSYKPNFHKTENSFQNQRNEKKIYSDIPLDYKYELETHNDLKHSQKVFATPLKNISKSQKKSVKMTLLKDMEKMNESIQSNETYTYNFNNFSKFSENPKILKSAPIYN